MNLISAHCVTDGHSLRDKAGQEASRSNVAVWQATPAYRYVENRQSTDVRRPVTDLTNDV